MTPSEIDDSRGMLQLVSSFIIIISDCQVFIVEATSYLTKTNALLVGPSN